jgi:hypothetical protein
MVSGIAPPTAVNLTEWHQGKEVRILIAIREENLVHIHIQHTLILLLHNLTVLGQVQRNNQCRTIPRKHPHTRRTKLPRHILFRHHGQVCQLRSRTVI